MTDNNNSRRQNAIINVITASGVYVLTMLLSLIVRGALARSLGQDYVGLNGVLTSVITSFAIADLGIDSVFIYLMYKPMVFFPYTTVIHLWQASSHKNLKLMFRHFASMIKYFKKWGIS